jgi:hypothetical protein
LFGGPVQAEVVSPKHDIDVADDDANDDDDDNRR